MTTKKFVVYEHWRPDTDCCFYVGKGSLSRAKSIERPHNKHHSSIVRKLKENGQSVCVKIVFSTTIESDAFEAERNRILYWRALGKNLVNATDGGEGPSGYAHTEDAKQKISEAHLGRKRPIETCQRIGDAVRGKNKGRKATAETCAKISAALTGKTVKETTKRKISEAHTGKIQGPHTEEHKAKIGAAHKGRKDSEEVRIKKSEAAKKRKPMSDEAREKIKEKIKSLWDDPEYRKRMVEAHTGKSPTQEARESMRRGQATRGPRTEEHCAKISAAIKKMHAERALRAQLRI